MTACTQRSATLLPLGWSIIRAAVGVAFIFHGLPKLMAGVERWSALGAAMSVFGVSLWPAFWGFMAAITEALGGLLLALGVGTRIWAVMLAFVMLVATLMKIQGPAPFSFGLIAHSATLGLVLVGLAVGGSGGYSLVRCPWLRRRRGISPDSDTLGE